ncbi:acyl-CoA carboxylase subunit epsilon [Cryobacterium adonitolivorans]|uniref:Acyl-CoA carboxylase subunit epsilon n=1 Tax=Cryobacterium adonitolivorans TaxID=1259189 RepID=A0A4R8WB07_9MICO|nr:acyl-CoA carboxylase epsilon subunit [Cryobacterium adonitolivorans]TFC05481.1 acyl-CoA carboxylase subunit epsilon [Cryobacterium adonitolivorans]
MTHSENTPGFDPAELTFVTTGVTEPEAAAVTAVLRAVLRAESDNVRATPNGPASPWQDSQRAIRAPLPRGDERWCSFTA